jgi:hypothetical protein
MMRATLLDRTPKQDSCRRMSSSCSKNPYKNSIAVTRAALSGTPQHQKIKTRPRYKDKVSDDTLLSYSVNGCF